MSPSPSEMTFGTLYHHLCSLGRKKIVWDNLERATIHIQIFCHRYENFSSQLAIFVMHNLFYFIIFYGRSLPP